jgi:hypothetical protein
MPFMQRLAGFILIAIACSSRAAESGPGNAVDQDAIKAHVEFLAHDLLEGRAAGTRGYDLAAAYVAAQFRQYGLQPAGDDTSFYQAVPLIEATPVLPGSSARFVHDDETVDFEYGTDYLPSADFFSASSTLTAPLVFAGFGIEAPELGHDDFQNIDLDGRIAVIITGAPAKFPNNQRAYYSSMLRKLTTVTEKGAVGLVLIDSLSDEKRTPWERIVAMSWAPQMRWVDEQGNPQDAYPELKLRFRFKREAAARLFEPSSTSLEQALERAEAGEPQGFELPGMLTLSATTGLRRTESKNVLAVMQGSDAKLKNEFVVVTAHLDHMGRGSSVDGDSIYNGAHDNAVGIGLLLEMARTLRTGRVKPQRSIMFAAVTAEEKGLLGSAYLARRAVDAQQDVVANLNIDMPLPLTRTWDFIAFGAEHSTLGNAARNAASAHGYKLSPDPMPEEVVFVRSDQFSFVRHGVPGLLLHSGSQARDSGIDLDALRREFLSTHYHQPSDDVSLPIDYSSAADLTQIHVRIALEAANGVRPRWNRGDFFAEKFPRPQ